MKTHTYILAAGASLLLLAGATMAHANEPYLPRGQKLFDRVDANKDGAVALPEFRPLAEKRLATADANGDGVVTAAELDALFKARAEKRRIRIMQLLDTNRDGNITTAELDKVVEDMFNDADADRNGGLSMGEIQGFKRAQWRRAFVEHIDTGQSRN